MTSPIGLSLLAKPALARKSATRLASAPAAPLCKRYGPLD